MSWVKEANKLGKYLQTYKGFRLYEIKAATHSERFEDRPNGRYRITEFEKGEAVAIDKTGEVVHGSGILTLSEKIDMIVLKRYFE